MIDKTTWVVAPPDDESPALAAALEVPPLVAALLRRRGVVTVEAAREFLRPRLDALSDPAVIAGIPRAVEVIDRALRSGRPIAIHGDYDVDGISATALLVRGLRALGADPLWHLPHRLRDGYGLGAGGVDALADRGASILVAVDCGISAHEAVARARTRGLDVVILDHHEAQSAYPPAAIVEPARDLGPGAQLCAAGLAFVFLWALRRHLGHVPAIPADLVALAALGTIGDVVPLLGDNRRLAAAGVEQIRTAPPVALRALMDEAGVAGPVGAWHVAWQLAPRLNSPGRLGDPTPALRLLLTDDSEEARALARAIDEANRERQHVLACVLDEAVAQAEADPQAPAFVLAREGWHPGVVGLVASRLVEQYRRPAVVIALAEGAGRGSARSIEGFHLVEALEACREHLIGFGGHAMAAGLSLAANAVEGFARCFSVTAAARIPPERSRRLSVDAEVALPDLTTSLVTDLERLGPFGPCNPQPVLAVRGVRAVTQRLVGDGSHLRIDVTDGRMLVEAIGFAMADRGELLTFADAPVNLAFVPELDRFEPGRVRLRLRGLEVVGVEPETVLADTGLLVERLFRHAADYLGEARYGGVEDAPALYTKVVGVTFEGRQATLADVRPGDRLRLIREPANPHDPHAIRVGTDDGRILGYLSAPLAGRLAPSFDVGARYRATAVALTGGGDRTLGLNIYLEREDDLPEGAVAPRRRGAGDPALADRLPIYLNAGRAWPPDLAQAFTAFAGGHSVVLALPPGRGRAMALAGSAALSAAPGRWALVVGPLRSLVEHRAEQLTSRLLPLGFRVVTVHGLLGLRDRKRAAAARREGDVDIVVSSAEALQSGDLMAPYYDRIAAVIVDGGVLRAPSIVPPDLAQCPVFVVTGRASHAAFTGLRPGAAVIVGDAPAPPLRIVDRRGTAVKEAAVEEVVAGGEKVVVHTARREECVQLADRLGERFPERASRVGYLHGGIPSRVRRVIAQAFREGRLDVLVATGALDEEGLPLDVRDAVIASLPFNRERFLTACGSAGLDRRPATTTMLFGPRDVDANLRALEERTPGRSLLVAIYRGLREWTGDAAFLWPDEETWGRVSAAAPGATRGAVAAACAIFEEVGLATRESVDGRWQVQLVPTEGRRDLEVSLRYREGLREREAFDDLARWVQGAPPGEILQAVVGRDGT